MVNLAIVRDAGYKQDEKEVKPSCCNLLTFQAQGFDSCS